ncbi:MAG TPA: ABC transporter ATP-binding protein [Candidatus Baltobacteraceae bacterium]|jgi:branched-chain amino acid transport system ATP-binding protein|nr:ABC transporter ATP-binding protein [Candidatus Baltobacteraceae bacterium]
MSAEYLRIRNVGVRFGGLQALSDVSFDVARGSVVGLIGPNGSGKTTLMSVIAGALRPSSGSVEFKARSLTGIPTSKVSRLGIARTFQIVAPFANLSVRENVAVGAMFGRRRRTTSAAFASADELLEFVGLARVARKSASDLTIPDRKRLEVAKALALDPEVILLDEVMAGLNAVEVDEALELLHRIHDGGKTLIVVEHLMKAILSISQRVIVLAEGKKIAQGSPQAVIRDPEVIKAYLGVRYAKRQARTASSDRDFPV